MKKMVLLAAIMLMGVIHNMNAQNETDYSLKEIGSTLSKLNLTSSGVCLGDFHDGVARVRAEKGNDIKYGFINKQGKIVAPCIYRVAEEFSEGLALVTNDNTSFFIDNKGKVVISSAEYDFDGSFSDGLARVKKGYSAVGFINKNAELVIPYFEGEATYFQDGFSLVTTVEKINGKKTFKISLLDKQGNKKDFSTLPLRSFGYKDGYFVMRSEESRAVGVFDTNGNIVVPMEYANISGFSDGLFLVNRNGYGYVNVQGKVVIPLEYNNAKSFSEELAAVEKDGKWGYINKQGEIAIPLQYENAFDFHEGRAFIKTNNGYALIDKQGQMVSPSVNYDYFGGDNFSEGLAVISLSGKWGYVDIYGNNTFNPKANPSMTATQSSQTSDNYSAQTINSSFKGGETAMKRFIASTMRYPVRAAENGIQGTVSVVFTVEVDGSLSNIRLKRPVARYLNEEALRIVSKMPKWQPAQSGGTKVRSEQTVDIIFRLR